MKNLILFVSMSLLVAACGKDKFNTKPTLTFKSINNKVISKNSELRFNLNVTDTEGDLTDTVFVMRRVRNCSNSNSNFAYKLPVFPLKTKLDINIELIYAYAVPNSQYVGLGAPACANKNDSVTYRFMIKDKAGNKSDTVNSPEFVILQ
jgi:hypothetical protein